MRSTITFGCVVVTLSALFAMGCDKANQTGEALSVPVPEMPQEPKVVKVSKTEVTAAEIKAGRLAAPAADKDAPVQEPGE